MALEKKRSKTTSSTSTGGMEDKETLKCGTIITHLADLVHYIVNNVLSNGIMTTGVVIGSVFLSINDGLTVGSKSTITARGTCFPLWVSLKNVLKAPSSTPGVLSLGISPVGLMPCSRQYSSQQLLPTASPACPMWIESSSRPMLIIC